MKAKIKEAIQHYLRDSHSIRSIMLSGPWGCGKTFFLKKDIFTLIRNESLIPAYISLIGLQSKEELIKRIHEKCNPLYQEDESTHSLFNESLLLQRIIEEDMNEENPPISKSYVLCLDDLERIKPDILEGVLGYINIFTEHFHMKVIYLCAEEELKDLVSRSKCMGLDNVEAINRYYRIKEKYIRNTFFYNTSIEKIIIERYEKQKHGKDVVDSLGFIKKIINASGTSNLRSIFSALNTFLHIIDNTVNLRSLEFFSKIEKRILFFVLYFWIEARDGIDPKFLFEIKNLRFRRHMKVDEQSNETQNTQRDRDNKIKQRKKIEEKYNSVLKIEEFHFFYSIADFYLYSYLNNEILEEEIKQQNNYLISIKGTIERILIQQLLDFTLLEDEVLSKRIRYVFKGLKEDLFSPKGIIDLFKIFVDIESLDFREDLINSDSFSIFREAFKRALVKYGSLKEKEIFKFEYRSPSDFDKYDFFIEQLEDDNREYNKLQHQINIQSSLDLLFNSQNPIDFIDFIKGETEYVFDSKMAYKLYEIYKGPLFKNKNRIELYEALEERYDGNFSIIHGDKDFILTLYNLIQKGLNSEIDSPSLKYHIKRLLYVLEDCIKVY